ncbi:hypothetical protein AX15_007958 [Amanita polypyramis BW_CC]|nr:hypothetical protein AX15_007958 [Amanita polypyramis BW_CC]
MSPPSSPMDLQHRIKICWAAFTPTPIGNLPTPLLLPTSFAAWGNPWDFLLWFFVRLLTLGPLPLLAPSCALPSTSLVLFIVLKLCLLTEPLPFVPHAAIGDILPMFATPTNPVQQDSLPLCPFFTHHFNPAALAELQKACLHCIHEAQASKAQKKPTKAPKGKGKA